MDNTNLKDYTTLSERQQDLVDKADVIFGYERDSVVLDDISELQGYNSKDARIYGSGYPFVYNREGHVEALQDWLDSLKYSGLSDNHTLIVPAKTKQTGKHKQPFYHKGKW